MELGSHRSGDIGEFVRSLVLNFDRLQSFGFESVQQGVASFPIER